MTAQTWIADAVGAEKIKTALEEAGRRRLGAALDVQGVPSLSDRQLRFIAYGLELQVIECMAHGSPQDLIQAAATAFQVFRVLPRPSSPLEAAEFLVQLGCLGVLGQRSADIRRLLSEKNGEGIPSLPLDADDWGLRVRSIILNIWLRLLRKSGWDDFNAVQAGVARLRAEQQDYEPQFLSQTEATRDVRPAWYLISAYHLAKAAEILGAYLTQGSVDGHYDIRAQLQAQFERALAAADRGGLIEQENMARMLERTALVLVESSIWTVSRGTGSRVAQFIERVTARDNPNPYFELLPPQRKALREGGLLGSGHRSVVVSLPTSGGKTLLAQFRMLQALHQFDHERGWIAYLAPTRALVNQLTRRLRKDFTALGIAVEKISPALEIDGLEAELMSESKPDEQFRILVTTPEKLDLMLRGDWERKIGRPLTLVVVDEAHGLGTGPRGLRLELLLATINRECRHAQFLLLTPFIKNIDEIAQWLDPDNSKGLDFGIEWLPNDRAIAIAEPRKGQRHGDFVVMLTTQHTTRNTIAIPETLKLAQSRPLGLAWSQVHRSPGKLAAATAQILQSRGTVIVLVDKPKNSWSVAESFKVDENQIHAAGDDLKHIQDFMSAELGRDFPLPELLEYGVGVHHAGLPEDVRMLVEWLTEESVLRALVATTTIAQGVNYPVAGVVFASHQYPYGQDMPPADFWNIVGRAGRLGQEDLGLVALVGHNEDKVENCKEMLQKSVGELNSTLVEMVRKAIQKGEIAHLDQMAWQSEWSSFVQYLAHSYRQIGSYERFVVEIEHVLRGTLGFQSLRKSHAGWADQLIEGVQRYAQRIQTRPLKLVDTTGFSWESVQRTLARIQAADLRRVEWSSELFNTRKQDLQRIVSVWLQIPELAASLQQHTVWSMVSEATFTQIICDWVQGRSLSELAAEHFRRETAVEAMTDCCRSLYGSLNQIASWGLAAMQAMTIGSEIENLSVAEQRTLRNLPARIHYGVNSDEAVALRLLGVPRTAAQPLADALSLDAAKSLPALRAQVSSAGRAQWTRALGAQGQSYKRVWEIISGVD